jgi:hypothetical protein
VIVVVVPVPAIEPGLIVHVPAGGNPLKITVPVDDAHEEGCVIVPTIGANGPEGASFMTTAVEGSEIHPASVVILNL